MKVIIVNGYGEEKETAGQQNTFLNQFKDLLLSTGLVVESIGSEREAGGPITIEVSTDNPDDVTKAFLTLATWISQDHFSKTGENIYVDFDLMFPFCSEPITIQGSIH